MAKVIALSLTLEKGLGFKEIQKNYLPLGK
jgi:hypothetical protein